MDASVIILWRRWWEPSLAGSPSCLVAGPTDAGARAIDRTRDRASTRPLQRVHRGNATSTRDEADIAALVELPLGFRHPSPNPGGVSEVLSHDIDSRGAHRTANRAECTRCTHHALRQTRRFKNGLCPIQPPSPEKLDCRLRRPRRSRLAVEDLLTAARS